jgi:hypothetical protein
MSVRILFRAFVALYVVTMAAHVSGGVPCTRVDSSTVAAGADGWSSPDVPLGDPPVVLYFDTTMAGASHQSSADDPWGGDGHAGEITVANVSVSAAPGATSAAPKMEATGQVNVNASVSDRQSTPCARGDFYAGPGSGVSRWVPTAPVGVLNGRIYLVATGGNTTTGDGQAWIFQGSFVRCSQSWLATQGGPTWTVNGVVGGLRIAEIHPGGLNDLYTWQETTFVSPIPVSANVSGPWAGGGTGVGSGQVATAGSGTAVALWNFIASAWFEVF